MKKQFLPEFLKEKRIKAGFSQQEVAEKLGYSSSQFVSNWERGVAGPPIETLKSLAKMYGVSLDEMFRVTLETSINKLTINLKRKFYSKKTGA